MCLWVLGDCKGEETEQAAQRKHKVGKQPDTEMNINGGWRVCVIMQLRVG